LLYHFQAYLRQRDIIIFNEKKKKEKKGQYHSLMLMRNTSSILKIQGALHA